MIINNMVLQSGNTTDCQVEIVNVEQDQSCVTLYSGDVATEEDGRQYRYWTLTNELVRKIIGPINSDGPTVLRQMVDEYISMSVEHTEHTDKEHQDMKKTLVDFVLWINNGKEY